MAALLMVRLFEYERHYIMPWMAAGVAASSLMAAILLHRPWSIGIRPEILLSKLVDIAVDKVSCAALGLHPDRKQDGTVEIVYRWSQPPLTLLGLRDPNPTYIRLERQNPLGAYETGEILYVLGVAQSPEGALMNHSDGSFTPSTIGEIHLFAHFCWDGHDRPDSLYQVNIEGQLHPIPR
jgi:hypothetical protein